MTSELRPLVRLHTDAVLARLGDAPDEGGLGLKVGDAKAPAGGPPYAVLYAIAGGATSGTLGELDADAELIYQVTCVGNSRKQAEWLADEAKGLLEGLIVAGRSIPRIALDSNPGIAVDNEQTPPIFTVPVRFRIFTTPSDDES